MNLKKYITNVSALQFFQIVRFGVLLLISIVLTKTKLRVGEIGVYETFLLIAGSVSFFWIGGMLQSLLAVFKNSKTFGTSEKNPILFNIFLLFTLISFLSAVLVLVSQPFISSLFSFHGNKIPYMRILFMYIVVSGPVNLVEYFYLLKNKPKLLIIYGIITFTLQLLCVTLPIIFTFDLAYGLYGFVFINGLRYLWLIVLVYRYSEIKISTTFLKEFLRLSSPLVLSILLSGSAQYFDGFLVSYKYDEATLAIFRYGARELPFIILLLDAFGNALTPRFSDPNNRKIALSELKTGTAKLMHILFPVAILIVLTSKYIYPIIFNQYFESSAVIFNIYVLIIITRFLFTRIILIGIKETKLILKSSLIEIVINISLSLILIQFWGIFGVAIATVISYLIEKLYLVICLKSKHNIKPSEYINLKYFSLYSLVLIIAFLLSFLLL
ncbi:MAG TPA: polysaccharide biosynthesis C-terminal domain-containing protein [Bacteroidales bacterium]|nr:polysaccharide biosynthesis C-terminal domain-containing protein [Bacteroidales bacterium]